MTPIRCNENECVGGDNCKKPNIQTYDDKERSPRYLHTCCKHTNSSDCVDKDGRDINQCNPRTIRGLGLLNWTTPYTLPTGLNQSAVWDHVIGPNECEGDDYNKASQCEDEKVVIEADGIDKSTGKPFVPDSSPCHQRQRMHAQLTLLFQWVEYTDNNKDDTLMAERVRYKLQNIGQYPPSGISMIKCEPGETKFDGCYIDPIDGIRKKVQTGMPLQYILLLTLSHTVFYTLWYRHSHYVCVHIRKSVIKKAIA